MKKPRQLAGGVLSSWLELMPLAARGAPIEPKDQRPTPGAWLWSARPESAAEPARSVIEITEAAPVSWPRSLSIMNAWVIEVVFMVVSPSPSWGSRAAQ